MAAVLIIYYSMLALAIAALPFLKVKWKGVVAVATVIVNALLAGYLAVNALSGDAAELILRGTIITGPVPLRIDALSAWFILVINFTMVTSALYGWHYMKAYREQSTNMAIHCIAYLLMQSMLTLICMLQHALVFLTAWEIMTIAAFLLVIFEHQKQETLKAGINFLIQSHVGVIILTLGFLWVSSRTGSYDFLAIAQFSAKYPLMASLALFLCFFVGFSFKAGFVPFHTWLPYAHPASPSHISAMMSGVMIKIGIYGILRMLLLVRTDYTTLGYLILFVAILSGIYGVMLAIVQHNLKKLLAYHSIENIGIIGIGIGLGTLGLGMDNPLLTTLGFAGALLHVLNHSLFKSLLFFSAGNVYQSRHTMNIDRLGGLVKRMPHTSILFLIAALAICGLPPFNGFISEFLIYSGLFKGFGHDDPLSILVLLAAVFGLAFIGGLAVLCFTKAFGSVFLGTQRAHFDQPPVEASGWKLAPMYMAMVLIVSIGLFPRYFLVWLSGPVQLFTEKLPSPSKNVYPLDGAITTLQHIGWSAVAFIALAGAIFLIGKLINGQRAVAREETWGCGYIGETEKMQYSASSFVRSYRKLFEPVMSIRSRKKEINGIFPDPTTHQTHPFDKIEEWLIDAPLKQLNSFFNRFGFLQNGNPQYYILYGVVFISLIITAPVVFKAVKTLIGFLIEL